MAEKINQTYNDLAVAFLLALEAVQGDTTTLKALMDGQESILDLNGGQALQVVCDGTEQTLLEVTGQQVPFYFAGGFIDWTGANSGGGEDTTVKVYVKVDGTNYRSMYEEVFVDVAVPDPVCTPFPRDADTDMAPKGFYSLQDVKVTIQQAAVGGGWNTLDYNIVKGQRGS